MDAADRATKLSEEAAAAARLRAYQVHPDVVALFVEKVRGQVDKMMWAGIILGLLFTMVNVQQFAAAGAPAWSLTWITAWLLDPMVSVVVLAVIRAEQVTARYQVRTGGWVRGTKWVALTAVYTMNTWQSWADGSASGVLLHSVPPVIVVLAAEAVTDLRDRITTAVDRALTDTRVDTTAEPTVGAGATTNNTALTEPLQPTHQPAATEAVASPPPAPGGDDLVAKAREVAEAHQAEHGRPPGRPTLRDTLGISDYKARQIQQVLNSKPLTTANGTGSHS